MRSSPPSRNSISRVSHVALQQEVAVLLAAVLVHAAAGMALRLVAQVERVMLRAVLEVQHLRREDAPCRFSARRWPREGWNASASMRTGTQARQWSQCGR